MMAPQPRRALMGEYLEASRPPRPSPAGEGKGRAGARGARSFSSPRLPSGRRPVAGHEADHPQQDDRADERSDEANDQATAGYAEDRRQQPTADKRADDADNDVHENSVAMAADDPPGQGARETADDQEHDELHLLLLTVNFGTEIYLYPFLSNLSTRLSENSCLGHQPAIRWSRRLGAGISAGTPAKKSRSSTPVTHGSGKTRTKSSGEAPLGTAIAVVTLTRGLVLDER